MLTLHRHPQLSAMRMATNCHRCGRLHQAVELVGMAVKDAGNGVTMGKTWRRERGRRNQRGGSRYNHLSSSHRLEKGREGWSSLDDNPGNLMATLTSVCSGQSSSTLAARTAALGVASMKITMFSAPMCESTSPTSLPAACGLASMW